MTTKKPIRVFYSQLTETFWATQHYKEGPNGHVEVTGVKYDVTQDIAAAVLRLGIEFHQTKPAKKKARARK